MKKCMRNLTMMALTLQLVFSTTMVCLAAGENYAENGAKWVLDQAFWIIIVVALIVAVSAWMRHATAAIVTTVLIAGILAFFCKNPEQVITMGETLARAITGG